MPTFLTLCIAGNSTRLIADMPRSCGKVMFSQASVCPQGGEGVCPTWMQTPFPSHETDPHGILRDTVKKRVVRILLECILVDFIQILIRFQQQQNRKLVVSILGSYIWLRKTEQNRKFVVLILELSNNINFTPILHFN